VTRTPKDPSPTGGPSAYTVHDLAILAEKVPEAYRELMAEKRNWRRLEWVGLMGQAIGHISGIIALLILGAIAWHAIDRGAATQGASIICTGAVSIVAVFVTGRITARPGRTARENPKELPDHRQSKESAD